MDALGASSAGLGGGNRDSQDEAGLMKGYKFSRAWCLVEIAASGRGHFVKGIAYGKGRSQVIGHEMS